MQLAGMHAALIPLPADSVFVVGYFRDFWRIAGKDETGGKRLEISHRLAFVSMLRSSGRNFLWVEFHALSLGVLRDRRRLIEYFIFFGIVAGSGRWKIKFFPCR